MGIEKRGAEFIPSDLRMFALQLLAVIQRDPSCAGFQFSPAFRGTGARAFHYNGEHANSRVLPGPRIVRSRAFADVQVRDRHLHQVWLK